MENHNHSKSNLPSLLLLPSRMAASPRYLQEIVHLSKCFQLPQLQNVVISLLNALNGAKSVGSNKKNGNSRSRKRDVIIRRNSRSSEDSFQQTERDSSQEQHAEELCSQLFSTPTSDSVASILARVRKLQQQESTSTIADDMLWSQRSPEGRSLTDVSIVTSASVNHAGTMDCLDTPATIEEGPFNALGKMKNQVAAADQTSKRVNSTCGSDQVLSTEMSDAARVEGNRDHLLYRKLAGGYIEFRAHRILLSSRNCDFFDLMFRSGMREARTRRIVFEDISASTMKYILFFLYEGHLTSSTINAMVTHPQIALEVMFASDKLFLTSLKEICIEILCQAVDITTVTDLLVAADSCQGATINHCIITHPILLLLLDMYMKLPID